MATAAPLGSCVDTASYAICCNSLCSSGETAQTRQAKTARFQARNGGESLDEQQIGDLLDDFQRVTDAARPEGVPATADLTTNSTGEHDAVLKSRVESDEGRQANPTVGALRPEPQQPPKF